MIRATVVAALLAGFVGCSAEQAGEDLPPTLEITSPERGTSSEGGAVTVTGRVTDDGPAVRVTVNGTEVVPAVDGTFSAQVTLDTGIGMIETHAIDGGGNDVRDVRAVLTGTLAPSDGALASPVGARLGVDGLAVVGAAIGETAEGIDFNAAIRAMNPVYNNTGCLGAKIDVTSVSLGNIAVGLVPKAGALATTVGIDNVVVRMNAAFKVACIGGNTTITVRTTKARINGDLGVRAASGTLVTSLPSATVALDGFSVDVGGVPGAIEDLLRTQARNAVVNALQDVIRDRVPPIANDTLQGLVARPYTANVLGHDTGVTVVPTEVSVSAEGLYAAVATKLVVSGGEGGVYVTTPTPISASLMQTRDLAVAIADDTVNQLFSGLWAAGALEQSLSIDTVGVLAALLDDDAATLDISLALPPTVSTVGGDLALAIGDLLVTVRDGSGGELQRLALSLRTTLTAGPTQAGKITLTVGAPEVYAQVLAQSDAVDRPLTGEQVEGIVTGVWGVVGGQADQALANLPMPTVAGVTFGAPTVEGREGYVVADLGLE